MSTLQPRPVTTLRVLSILLLPLAGACGGATPPAAVPAPPAFVTATPAPRGAASAQGTREAVSISDEILRACGITSRDAFFAFDSAALEASDVAPLDAVARCFASGPLQGRSLRLVGHADSRGPSEYNMTLGQRRADSVGTYLDRRGVQRSRLQTTSRGAADATGVEESGWAKDRRVDVLLGS